MKMLMLVVCMILAVSVAGCEGENTTDQIKEFAVQAEKWVTSMDEYQAAASKMLETAKTHEIVGDTIVKKVVKVSEEIDRVQPQVADVIAAMIRADTSGDDEVDNWVKLLQAGNQASTPWNPYALPATAALSLISMIWGFIKKKEAEKNRLKYKAHKQGVEKTVISMNTEAANEIYDNIGDARADLGVK
ncbi:hypothetical protein LCGC14_0400180 [marine sediment metagenome]|uniref:Uncharacterized protein n=1 Tax=marine sediment metagenome TaxID=412755 RepID=A0A0F9W5Z9_9ZZZZ